MILARVQHQPVPDVGLPGVDGVYGVQAVPAGLEGVQAIGFNIEDFLGLEDPLAAQG